MNSGHFIRDWCVRKEKRKMGNEQEQHRKKAEHVARRLREYSQADQDGIMVRVSRQACEEGASMIESMSDALSEVALPMWTDSDPVSLLQTLRARAQSVLDQFGK